MAEKNGEKTRREKLLELQMLDSKIKQSEQQLMNIEGQAYEVNAVIESLDELKKVRPGEEILVPVANGIFIKAKVTENNNLRVNVGSGAVVEKTLEETKDMLKEQLKSIEAYKDETFLQLQRMVIEASALQAEILGEK